MVVSGRRTSMRLEAAFWDGLAEIARREEVTVSALCTRLSDELDALSAGSLSSAVRVYVMEYFRAATPKPEVARCEIAIAAE
ncbi:ribbon-helix-helix domain-containing protein [Azospirillum argentinense]